MSTMTKKRVAELEGAQLDHAVALAKGWEYRRSENNSVVMVWFVEGQGVMPCRDYRPSIAWIHGGPIIERERITIDPIEDNQWAAHIVSVSVKGGWLRIIGHTPLIAAMRAFVASKLGDEVEVPE